MSSGNKLVQHALDIGAFQKNIQVIVWLSTEWKCNEEKVEPEPD